MKLVVGTMAAEQPKFWEKRSPYFLRGVDAVMFSFLDFIKSRNLKEIMLSVGFEGLTGLKGEFYLDNGAFFFSKKRVRPPINDYVDFVRIVKPDWYPVPADFIPFPFLSSGTQRRRYKKTIEINDTYSHDGFVPVIHVGSFLNKYLDWVKEKKPARIALGGLVPYLLTGKGTGSKQATIESIKRVRETFGGDIHAFGIGGVFSLHLAAALGIDSVDSSGWRNRAARGVIQLPGLGDRLVVKLGSWDGRRMSREERALLEKCPCPICSKVGLGELKRTGARGFRARAVHNLYIIIKEARLINTHIELGDYDVWYSKRLRGHKFKYLIEYVFDTFNVLS